MSKKRVTKVGAALTSMNKEDIYSLMLFTLYRMKDDPDFLTLSELSYILDGENLTKFLSYYGGMTITIPTLKDLRLVMQGLLLFQYVNLEKKSLDEGVKLLKKGEFNIDDIKNVYMKICEVVDKYEFNRE